MSIPYPFIWNTSGGSGSSSDSFSTFSTPAGTSPVADSTTDTLSFTSSGGSITITGNSSTDTINFDIAGTFAQNSFSTIDCPAGTDPIADSSTDTLVLTSSDSTLVITGDSSTDTVNFTIGSGINIFKTIDCPAGTDPVADSSTDTLVLTSSDSTLVITGDSSSDTIDFTIGSGINIFKTISTPAGTSPVADSSTDTLNLTSSGGTVTITGTSGTDTINFDLAATYAQNSFVTIDCPLGTDPVADSATDTLTFTSTSTEVSITGTSGTDTIDFRADVFYEGAGSSLFRLRNIADPLSTNNCVISLSAVAGASRNTVLGANLFTGGGIACSDNVAVGHNAGNIITSSQNSLIGSSCAPSETTGSRHSAVGYKTLFITNASTGNTMMGWSAGVAVTTGGSNCGFGLSAHSILSVGGNNIAIGAISGLVLTTGSGNIALGAASGHSGSGVSNEMVVGSNGFPITQVYWGKGGVVTTTPTAIIHTNTPASGINIAGSNLTFVAGQGTGSGVGGIFRIQVAPAGGSGNSLNAVFTIAAFDSTKLFTLFGQEFIDGQVDVVQQRIQANGTQTANLTDWENSSATVLASVDALGRFLAPLGAIANAGYGFIGDPNTGMYSTAANTIDWTTNGAQKLQIDTNGNIRAFALHNNATAQGSAANQDIRSGTYTATFTNVANLDGTPSTTSAQFLRVGNVVTVSGRVNVNPTTTVTSTKVGISLPIASNFGATEDCAGTAYCDAIATQGAAIKADAANDRAQMEWIAADITAQDMYFIFTYEVI